MLNTLLKIGQFIRLIDENGQLSLTNISIMISLYKLLTVSNASYMEVGTFLISALAYNYKKNLNITSPTAAVTITQPPSA